MNSKLLIVIGMIGIGILTVFVSSQVSAQPISYAQPIFNACHDDDNCTIDKMYEISGNSTSKTIFLTIDDLLDLYVGADFYCHPNAHHLGEFLYGYVKRDLKKASTLNDYRCASGIMHGLIENSIQIDNMLDKKSIESINITEPCKKIEETLGDDAKKECIHGIGHSLVKFYNYNTTLAIERCNEFADWQEIFMCNGGLFMQNMNEYVENDKGDFDSSDIYYPCDQIDGDLNNEAATLCYGYQANYFWIVSKFNLESTYSFCKGIPDKQFIPVCFKGVSSYLTVDNFYDLGKTYLMCTSAPTEYKEVCVIGAVESLTRFVSVQKAEEFCQKFPEELKEKCISRKNSLLDIRY